MTNHAIYLVPTEYVAATRPHIWDFLERGAILLDDGRSAEDLMEAMSEGLLQLWLVSNGESLVAIGITEIPAFTKRKICRVFLVIGEDRKDWLHLLSEVEDWARTQNCEVTQAFVRPGWARDLKGYRKTRLVLEKRL